MSTKAESHPCTTTSLTTNYVNRENVATTIGIYFDGCNGTLTYYKDGACLGRAFAGLAEVEEPLYPIVCSTAAKTEMALGVMKREFFSLQVKPILVFYQRP